MSASNEWTEWHLTPVGWQRGTEKEDFRRVDREPPVDRVLTVVYKEFMSSTFSPMEKSSEIDWRSPDEVTIAALTAKYGPAPQNL
jgi:hypothetical protein